MAKKGDHSSSTHKDIPNKAGATNWVEKAGGLPNYIRRIAKHLVADEGFTVSHAIATAVNTVKKWSRGGGGVTAKTQAKAAKALAQWNAKKGASRGLSNVGDAAVKELERRRIIQAARGVSESVIELRYNPNQPRDTEGRWTDKIGFGGKKSSTGTEWDKQARAYYGQEGIASQANIRGVKITDRDKKRIMAAIEKRIRKGSATTDDLNKILDDALFKLAKSGKRPVRLIDFSHATENLGKAAGRSKRHG